MAQTVTPIEMGSVAVGTSPTLLFTAAVVGTYTVTTMRRLHITNRTSTAKYLTAWVVPPGFSPADAYLIAHELPVQAHRTRTYSAIHNMLPESEVWVQADAVGLTANASGAGVKIT